MNVVSILNKEYSEILTFLEKNKQPSLSSDLNKHFKKVLILSSASYFEEEIQKMLIDFVSITSNNDDRVISFLKKYAIDMQYHRYFDWGEKNNPKKPRKNANAFFSIFGVNFKDVCAKEIKEDSNLNKSVINFLEIGHLRNCLVHRNFAAQNIENLTTEEIYSKFESALVFLEY